MKTILVFAAISNIFTAALLAADRPSGQKTPEGVSYDAVQAYADCDSKAWLKTLIRPIFGEKGKNLRLHQVLGKVADQIGADLLVHRRGLTLRARNQKQVE